ncbi:MAG: REP-associated tyrosine transposase [Thermoleophilaceae bacterium]|nr:REP-associated tyrosine transposase [Thermoleophilaceae bacterium]MEA2353493.1 REP-associated tyrosine transposase [Thermoleophilaceae bacterium]
MARQPRAETEPGIHHVFARGNDRGLIFRNDGDRRVYLRLLAEAIARMSWRCLSYCLMDNHVHLLVETQEPNLGVGMHRLHGGYAQFFNRRYSRVGHLFQGRFGSVRVESDQQLWTVVRYVALNPVEANYCVTPDDYPWSSHGATLRAEESPILDVGRLLEYFAAAGGEPRLRYREFVAAPAPGHSTRARPRAPLPI